MKKIIVILSIIVLALVINKEDKEIIPKESIRFRVIANSNSKEDQIIKRKVLKNIRENVEKTKSSKSINETRLLINKELPEFSKNVEKTLTDNGKNENFHINYGKNYFPRKEYKNVIYEEGEYESLVITLGEGKGNNFWCVLFPPICTIDKNDNNEYKSWIKETFDKYF